jgi:nucleotide-binding universal stress UspA family protein
MTSSNFNILIPTDFSEQSIQAIKYAQVISRDIKSSIHFIYVIEVNEQNHRNNH